MNYWLKKRLNSIIPGLLVFKNNTIYKDFYWSWAGLYIKAINTFYKLPPVLQFIYSSDYFLPWNLTFNNASKNNVTKRYNIKWAITSNILWWKLLLLLKNINKTTWNGLPNLPLLSD